MKKNSSQKIITLPNPQMALNKAKGLIRVECLRVERIYYTEQSWEKFVTHRKKEELATLGTGFFCS